MEENLMFKKAERKNSKLRLAFTGPGGSGKTYSSIKVAIGLGGKIALLDTETGSASLYAGLANFDVANLAPPFSPQKYIQAIKTAESMGYNVLIIDSLSHAWAGEGGILDEVDKRKSTQKNQFTAWRDVTPHHNALINAILQSSCHIIATLRTKTAYDMQTDERGRLKPVKIGLAPIQRDGLEYEFTVVLDIDADKHIARSSKDRTGLFDGQYFVPNVETGKDLKRWLEQGQKTDKVEKIQFESSKPQLATEAQVKKINVIASKLKLDRDSKISRINSWLNNNNYKRVVESSKDLTKEEASKMISDMEQTIIITSKAA